jgi:hypothetical protein
MVEQRGPARWALYYVPAAEDPLWTAGCRWLGREPATGEIFGGGPPERLVAAPALYGFHATLKPPFNLADGRDADGLRAAAVRLAAAHRGFLAPPLQISRIGGPFALTLSAPCKAIHSLSDRCVRELDWLRAPPTADELARRRAGGPAGGLSPRQAVLLQRWGYPLVMDQFLFHLTLTGPVGDEDADVVRQMLIDWFGPLLNRPLPVTELALFCQDEPGQPFRLTERLPLLPIVDLPTVDLKVSDD